MDSALHVQVRPRTRGPTPLKLATVTVLADRKAESAAAQLRWLTAIGDNGGFLTFSSSPHVMWLALRLAARS